MATKTVVLAHGIFRFDKLSVLFQKQFGLDVGPHYFDGIAEFLRRNGFEVHEPDVNFTGSLAVRARDLRKRLVKVISTLGSPSDRIHIIGHSMGGLDARKVIVDHPDIAARIACLTTVGTPHLGTKAADRAMALGGRLLIAGMIPILDLEGFEDLTTTACRAFNDSVKDAEATNTVRYRAVSAEQDVRRTTPLLSAAWVQLDIDRQGPSDGIVPTKSQQWTAVLKSGKTSKTVEQLRFPFSADHLNEVGLWDTGELLGGLDKDVLERRVQELYLKLARSAS